MRHHYLELFLALFAIFAAAALGEWGLRPDPDQDDLDGPGRPLGIADENRPSSVLEELPAVGFPKW